MPAARNKRERVMPATLDTKGMSCPLPVLKLKRAIKAVAPGDTLTVLATDPGAGRDFETFCRSHGHELLDRREQAGIFTFVIRRSA